MIGGEKRSVWSDRLALLNLFPSILKSVKEEGNTNNSRASKCDEKWFRPLDAPRSGAPINHGNSMIAEALDAAASSLSASPQSGSKAGLLSSLSLHAACL